MNEPDRADVVARLRAAGCVFAEDEADLLLANARERHDHHGEDDDCDTLDGDDLDARVARRCAGEPLELVIGWVEFCGARVTLEPGVFVPRRRTEVLARAAIALTRPGATVVDLCCGSGAIGLAIATHVSGVRLFASDIDAVAVRCALGNLASVSARVCRGDLFDPLPSELVGTVDILVANVPYVPSSAVAYLPAEAREYEPRYALDGGDDGLDVMRRIAAQAPTWLAVDGRFLVETSPAQCAVAVDSMGRFGLDAEVVDDEDMDVAIVIGRRVR